MSHTLSIWMHSAANDVEDQGGQGIQTEWVHTRADDVASLESELALLRREFPMQDGPPIPWRLAEEIYAVYHDVYGNDQTLERLAERGGFGWGEIPVFRKDYMSKRGSWPWIRELIKEQEGETT